MTDQNCKWSSQTLSFCKTHSSKEADYYKFLFYSSSEPQMQCNPQPKKRKSTHKTNEVHQHWEMKIANEVHKHQISARPTCVKKQYTTNLSSTVHKRHRFNANHNPREANQLRIQIKLINIEYPKLQMEFTNTKLLQDPRE